MRRVRRFKTWPGGRYTRQLEATVLLSLASCGSSSILPLKAGAAGFRSVYMACACLVLCPRRYMLVPWRALAVDALKDAPRVLLRSHVLKPDSQIYRWIAVCRVLLSRPAAGAAPLAMEEALGFDSPVGQPSGTSSTALQKVRNPLAQPRTHALPMHRSC